ncbi:MAG TPA: accessory gene regulator B family protein, partial [Syntrophomonadaceae bacterium]|nr:accessory gene regulator B family protein [Syntrophomonadaceae bacterium]
ADLVRFSIEYLQEQLELSQDETEVVLYGLQTIVYSLTGILTICFAGWLLRCFWTTLAVALTAGSLRLLSGGAHSKSPLICNLLGMVIAPFLAKTAEFAAGQMPQSMLLCIVLIGASLSLLAFYLLAPVDSAVKPITNKPERRKYNRLSVALTALITLGQITLVIWGNSPAFVLAVSFGTWWQAFTLTKAGHRFTSIADHLFLKEV